MSVGLATPATNNNASRVTGNYLAATIGSVRSQQQLWSLPETCAMKGCGRGCVIRRCVRGWDISGFVIRGCGSLGPFQKPMQ